MIKGLLGQIMGETATNKQSLLDTATQNATDLSAFVKRKSVPNNPASSALKRSVQEQAQEGDTKRARVDDASETST